MRKPKINGILETALYVTDLKRSYEFYIRLFDFESLFSNERMQALKVNHHQILLLFLKGASSLDEKPTFGAVPANDGSGELHLAFAIAQKDLGSWERWLTDNHIEIESKVQWPRGGISLYFRDPDKHSLELATPGLWSNY